MRRLFILILIWFDCTICKLSLRLKCISSCIFKVISVFVCSIMFRKIKKKLVMLMRTICLWLDWMEEGELKMRECGCLKMRISLVMKIQELLLVSLIVNGFWTINYVQFICKSVNILELDIEFLIHLSYSIVNVVFINMFLHIFQLLSGALTTESFLIIQTVFIYIKQNIQIPMTWFLIREFMIYSLVRQSFILTISASISKQTYYNQDFRVFILINELLFLKSFVFINTQKNNQNLDF